MNPNGLYRVGPVVGLRTSIPCLWQFIIRAIPNRHSLFAVDLESTRLTPMSGSTRSLRLKREYT